MLPARRAQCVSSSPARLRRRKLRQSARENYDVVVCDGGVTMVSRKNGQSFHQFAASVSAITRRYGTPDQELQHELASRGPLPNSRMYFRGRDEAGNVYASAYRMIGEQITTSEAMVAAGHAICTGGA